MRLVWPPANEGVLASEIREFDADPVRETVPRRQDDDLRLDGEVLGVQTGQVVAGTVQQGDVGPAAASAELPR